MPKSAPRQSPLASRTATPPPPRPLVWALALAALAAPGLAAAQAVHDGGSLLRENERGSDRNPARPPPAEPAAPAPISPSADNGVRFTLGRFVLRGATLVPESELQALLAPWRDRPIGFADLQRAGDALAAEYRSRGWLARILVPTQDVTDGAVTLQITEAKLGSVRVESDGGPLSLQPSVIVGTLTARQKPGEPIRLDHLERAANLLGDIPGVAAGVTLVPGRDPGTSDVVVKALDKPARSGLVQLDNHGSRSVGEARLSAGIQFDNPRGVGDQALLHGALTEGSAYLRAGYWHPVGYDGGRAGIAASLMQYRLLREFRALDASGQAQTLSFYGRYPLVRGAQRNATLNATLDLRHYRDRAGGVESDDKQAQVLTLGVGGDHSDDHGGGGFMQWDANATLGRIDLSGNAVHEAADRAGPHTAGRFGKVTFNLARLQRLQPATTLWMSFSGQLGGKNLDSSEQFSLGGPNGVRAYPTLEGQGDSGLLATLELRHQVSRSLQLTAFFDAGQVQRRDNPNYAGAATPNDIELKGWGIGAHWNEPGRYAIRMSLARRIGSNPGALPSGADSDGSLRRTRVWVAGIVYF
ncbi:ShlB/FhaC/HecB family hemolysin secretion/activation protein [soil metagenome]